MIREQDGGLRVEGRMTLEAAHALLEAGRGFFGVDRRVDLSAVEAVDSAALAVLFGWMREAKKHGKSLSIENPPAQLMSLAELYGVAELLPRLPRA